MRKFTTFAIAALVLATGVPVAQAGGYDTPMLYSARHMGLGGAAAGYVNDPSALFHNPAGLGHTERLTLMLNVSPLFGSIEGAPNTTMGPLGGDIIETSSETTFAPFFLAGVSYRLTDWMVAGLAVYPVASAGATYRYDQPAGEIEDRTKLVFIEASPGLAFNLPGNVRLGVGYRLTLMTLERFRGVEDNADLDFELSGINAASFRIGAQWTAIDDPEDATGATRNALQFGAGYRHRTVIDVSNDTGRAAFMDFTDVTSTFTLPGKLNFGARWDRQRVGLVADFEYTLNSQNETSFLVGDNDFVGDDFMVANVFAWQDAITVRSGVEYRAMDEGQLAIRAGYVFDGQTANPSYPTAFGTPPAPTHVFTAGVGYDAGSWELNFAGAYRTGETEVTQEDIDAAPADLPTCLFCSQPGRYAISLAGVYLDFSYELN